MLAKAACHSPFLGLTYCIREQARSHIDFCQSVKLFV